MNKTFITVLILIVVILGGYFLLKNPEAEAPTTETPTAPISTGNNIDNSVSSANQNIITYSDTGYSSNMLNIKVGEKVTFQHQSTQNMWTASGMHPTHKVYPTTGGCLGSTFDACKGIQPGDSWSFKFDVTGNWKYHAHLKPDFFGTVVVK